MNAATQTKTEFFHKCWKTCAAIARTPVTGVKTSDDVIVPLLENIFHETLDSLDPSQNESSIVTELGKTTATAIKDKIAKERIESDDHERHRDPEDKRYEKNLNLYALQENETDSSRNNRGEWSALEQLLRPFSYHSLSKKGVMNQDAEDVYYETLAELARPKKSTGEPPIRQIRIFEEIIPFFCRMIQFRCIDWQRKQKSLKNQPNTQDSVEGLMEAPGFNEKRFLTEDSDAPRFDEIYAECKEHLTSLEWEIIYKIYISAEATIKDLIADTDILTQMELDEHTSDSTKRRRINDLLDEAKRKLAKLLIV